MKGYEYIQYIFAVFLFRDTRWQITHHFIKPPPFKKNNTYVN